MKVRLTKLFSFAFILLSMTSAKAESHLAPEAYLSKRKVRVKQDIYLNSGKLKFTDLFAEKWSEIKDREYKYELSAWLNHKSSKKNRVIRAGTILKPTDVNLSQNGLFISFKDSEIRSLNMIYKANWYEEISTQECSSYWESSETSLFMAPYEVKHCYPASGFKTIKKDIPVETVIQSLETWFEFSLPEAEEA